MQSKQQNIQISAELFGNKASIINTLIQKTNLIPKTFFLSIKEVKDIYEGNISSQFLRTIEDSFSSLKNKSVSGNIIIRSSSIYENQIYNSFAGLFKTEHNVKDFTIFIEAINNIKKSANNKYITQYANDFGIDTSNDNLGIIVQEQIENEWSGIAYLNNSSIFIELITGHSILLASGKKEPVLTAIYSINNQFEIVNEFDSAKLPEYVVKLIPKLFSLNTYINEEQSIIEFGISNKELYVFQIRATKDLHYKMLMDSKIHKTIDNKIGNKARAMRWFQENNLFTKNVLILPPKLSIKSKKELITKNFNANDLLTIRYSFKNRISLPRIFKKGVNNVIKHLINKKYFDWTAIIHKYININKSFELIIDGDNWVLEHIPGIWESDNSLFPDAIHSHENTIKIWCYQNDRIATFNDNNYIKHKNCKPLYISELEKIAYKIKPIVKQLRNNFSNNLPIMAHFVEDNQGEWQFLNIRPTKEYENIKIPVNTNNIYVVSNIIDLINWDKKSIILLNISIPRGNETELLALAKALPKDINIFINFGLLSHPAMILREYGCKVAPSYLLSKFQLFDQNYQYREIQGDLLLEPYDRIMAEKPIIDDDYYHIVLDREQIVNSHLLVVSKEITPSIADSIHAPYLIEKLKNLPNLNYDELIYFERGRANFCTSGFTSKQAHAHIFNKNDFSGNIITEFAVISNSDKVDSLIEAFHLAKKTKGEYFIFGSQKDGFYLKTNLNSVNIEKRFIRKFLSENKKCRIPLMSLIEMH
jgi:hypothetical protein